MQYLGLYGNGTNQQQFLFSGVDIGVPNPNRTIILAVQGNNDTITSLKIGGVEMVELMRSEVGSSLYFYALHVPLGASTDVVVTFDESSNRCSFGVYSVLGDIKLHDTNERQTTGDLLLDVVDNGYVICCGAKNPSSAISLDTNNVDFEQSNSGEGARFTSGHESFATAITGHAVNVDFGASSTIPNSIAMSFYLDDFPVIPPVIIDEPVTVGTVAIDYPVDAGGRLTLQADTPVMDADILDADVLYYAPHKNNYLPLHDGTKWNLHEYTGNPFMLSDALAPNTVYDVFIYNDSGVLKLCVGDAWVGNDRVSLIPKINGVMTDNGKLYVGTILINDNGNLDMMFDPTPKSGGCGNLLSVWNYYNRVDMTARNLDAGDEYSYNSSTTRVKRNSSDNSITFVQGERQAVSCYSGARCDSSTTVSSRIGIGLDSTSVISRLCNTAEFNNVKNGGDNLDMTGLSIFQGGVDAGKRTLYALERGPSSGGTVLWRDNYNGSDRHYQGMNLSYKG